MCAGDIEGRQVRKGNRSQETQNKGGEEEKDTWDAKGTGHDDGFGGG